MKAGDVLFFNGNLIHGSFPNQSQTRFRRSFIGHYCGLSTARIGNSYRPLYRFDGTVLDRDVNMDSGPCGGEFVEKSPH
jgi:phytanoyl-CoA hydroxylase